MIKNRNSQEKTLIILPAAGYGRRVGSPPAKELFLHPKDKIELILRFLLLSHQYNFETLVISRADKIELNEFLLNKKREFNFTLLKIEPTEDWMNTCLASHKLWHKKNILALPDTEFSPQEILLEIEKKLSRASIVYACHRVENPSGWGVIEKRENDYYIFEKNLSHVKNNLNNYLAWGIIGFHSSHGKDLLLAHEKSQKEQIGVLLQNTIEILRLNHFLDLTRDKSSLK